MFVNSHLNIRSINVWLITIYSLLILMILVGGLTRLTDSGLSITQWELFKGIFPPLNNAQWEIYFSKYKQIPEFKYLNSDITLQEFKIIFYWEYSHRLLGRLIGLITLVPLIYFFYKYKNQNKFLKRYSIIFILVCLQGVIGWYMVESGLVDKVDVSHFRLATHLFLAFVILSLCFWFILERYNIEAFTNKLPKNFLLSILILLFAQIILGAFLAGLDGGLIYNTWPDMDGNFFPNDAHPIIFFTVDFLNTPSVIQFIHRLIAYILLAFIIYLNYLYLTKNLPKLPLLIFDLSILIQMLLGIVTILSGAKIIYASLHQIGSIFVVSSFLFILFKNNKVNLQLSN